MSRVSTWAAVLIAPALLSCAHTAPQTVDPLPPGCVEISAPSLTLQVDAEAQVDQPCVRVRAGQTRLLWEGAAGLRTWVAFQKGPGLKPPVDPGCRGRSCDLPKRKVVGAGEHKYTVVVVREDGSVASVDPRLIIRP